MAMPHGASVGGPYSSWLKKLPQRAMPWAKSVPGMTVSRPRLNRDLLPAGVQDDPDGRTENAAEHAQPAEADRAARSDGQDRAQRVLAVDLVPLVDHVVEPATDERQDEDDDERVPDVLALQAAPLRLELGEVQQDAEADDVADAVPGDRRLDRAGTGQGQA